MNERHREILRKARPTLVDKIVSVEGICDRLISYDVLTEDMAEEIMLKGTRARQVRALLDIIPRRGQNAYDYFHQALVETSNQLAADILKPELAEITPEQKMIINSEFEPEHKPSTGDQLTMLQNHPVISKAPSRLEPVTSKQNIKETIAQQPFDISIDTNMDELSSPINNTPYSVQPENSNTGLQVSSLVCDKDTYNRTEENSCRPSLQNDNTSSCQEESMSSTGMWSLPADQSLIHTEGSRLTKDVRTSQTDELSKPKLGTQESCNEDDIEIVWPSSDDHTSLTVKLKEPASENIKWLMENDKAYDLSEFSHSGRVIIINNEFCKICTENSSNLQERKNARRDYTKSSQLFKALKFKPETFTNKSYQEIDLLLKKAQEFDYSNHGCLIMVIMSHGQGKAVYCSDGKEMNIDYILGLFTDEKCPSLKGKPKLFFIQACQEQALYQKEEFGGKFIWAFAYVVQELSHEKDLLVIMKMVNKLLSDRDSDIPAVQCTNSLRKKFYLCAYDKVKQK